MRKLVIINRPASYEATLYVDGEYHSSSRSIFRHDLKKYYPPIEETTRFIQREEAISGTDVVCLCR